jgi:hypothetical protein
VWILFNYSVRFCFCQLSHDNLYLRRLISLTFDLPLLSKLIGLLFLWGKFDLPKSS